MPNRILRDWTDSEAMNSLSFQAESLFTRLIMKADDFGCFHANPKLIKGALFPLRDIKDSDISKWLDECHKAGLIAFYSESSKTYLFIKNFGQRLRTMKKRFPQPNDSNLLTNGGNPPPETKRNEVETNPKQNTETEIEVPPAGFDFVGEFNLITGRNFKATEGVKKSLAARLKKYSPEEILRAVQNCFNDPWHSQNPKYLTPEFILREEKLEKYRQTLIIPITDGRQINPAAPKGWNSPDENAAALRRVNSPGGPTTS